MARSALWAAGDLLGTVAVLLLIPATLAAQDRAVVRVSAEVVAPEILAPQMSAARQGASVVESVRTADRNAPRVVGQADEVECGAVVSLAVVAHQAGATSGAEPADLRVARVVRVTVAYAGN